MTRRRLPAAGRRLFHRGRLPVRRLFFCSGTPHGPHRRRSAGAGLHTAPPLPLRRLGRCARLGRCSGSNATCGSAAAPPRPRRWLAHGAGSATAPARTRCAPLRSVPRRSCVARSRPHSAPAPALGTSPSLELAQTALIAATGLMALALTPAVPPLPHRHYCAAFGPRRPAAPLRPLIKETCDLICYFAR